MTPKEHVELSELPAIDISYASAKLHYSGAVAALMDKLASSKTSAKAKAMKPQDFKWSIVFNRSEDPPNTTDPKVFVSYLSANSKHWLKARGGGWKNYEELPGAVPQQVLANYEQRASLICHQRSAAESGEHESEGQDHRELIRSKANNLWDAFVELTDQGGDPRLVSVAKGALEMLIEDVLE